MTLQRKNNNSLYTECRTAQPDSKELISAVVVKFKPFSYLEIKYIRVPGI
jgi:hypothetical protein